MKLKKKILATLVAIAVSSAVMAQNAVLENEFVRAGVNAETGTFGSGGNTSPGLLYDNTGTRTFNTSYDYLTPGSPFDGFAVKVNGTNYSNNNAMGASIAGGWTSGTTTSATGADWTGTFSHGGTTWGVRNVYSLPASQPYVDITSSITAGSAATQVWFGRFIDPDARAAAGDSSQTDNVIGYGAIPTRNIVFSEALSSRYALGIYSTNSNAYAGIQGWTQEADGYQTSFYGSNFGSGDDTIGLSWVFNGVSVGDILTVNYAYIFGPNAFGAAESAIDGGAGGGDNTILTGTFTDVGSATDAASSPTPTPTPPAAPTVVSTSTATITVSDVTAISASLPVLTASLAHHDASEGSGKQTIARETTTSVTTPMERTVVTKVRTTLTWSDGSTTYTDSATSSSTALSNAVETSVANDSFSGRIDQMSELNNLNKQLDRSLNMDAFRQDGQSRDDITMYINASGSRASMNNGYSARNQIYGLALEKNIDKDWRLGVQYNRVNTTMNGVDSTTGQDKNHVGVYSVYDLEGFKIVNNLGYADNTVRSNRTIQGIDFNNSHSTKGSDLWLNNRVYSPDLEGFRPFVGVTAGKSTVNGYQEAGSIQSARTVAGTTNNYTYGEGGVRYEKSIDDFRLAGEVSQTTDSFTTGLVSVGYAPDKNSLVLVMFANQQSQGINNNTVSLRGIIRF
jgi:hypothetical protein